MSLTSSKEKGASVFKIDGMHFCENYRKLPGIERRFTEYILFFLFLFWILPGGVALSQNLDPKPSNLTISLNLKEQPLKSVAKEINSQTGYQIIFDEKWSDLPVSGLYSKVSLEDFFSRALRKQNATLFYDDKNKAIFLRFFGDRGADVKAAVAVTGANIDREGVSQDVKALHKKQHEDLQAYLNDPEAVDPMSGMKLVEIRELHSAQEKEVQKMMKNPETQDPVSGMKIGEIQQVQDAQKAEIDRMRNDPAAVDPESGMSRAEIEKLHEAQRAEIEELKRNPPLLEME